MFKFAKKLIYLIGITILFSKIFACTDGGGGCISMALIPEGYRAQKYQNENPVLENITQVRLTDEAFDFVKNHLSDIIKVIMPEMYMAPDGSGNPRARICISPIYGRQGGFEYGVASGCDRNSCDLCGVNPDNYSDGVLCPNDLRCFNGQEGSDLVITMLKDTLVLEPRDDGTDADIIYGHVELQISDVPFWTNGIWPTDNDHRHTECNVEMLNDIPVSLDVDFTLNTLNPAETSFEITNINYEITEDDMNIECTSSLQASLINLVKGMIIDQITPVIDGMIQSLSDTMLCAKTVPVDDEDLSQGFQCPLNAPVNASAGAGCSSNEECKDGFYCDNGFCKTNIQCNLYDPENPDTYSHRCESSYCDKESGECIVPPYCMESENRCWKQKLGVDGKIDLSGLIGKFIEKTGHSWLNFYLNLGDYAKLKGNGMNIGVLAGTSSDYDSCVTPDTRAFSKIIPEITMFDSNRLDDETYHIGMGISQYFINQLLANFYNAGALCLDIDSKFSSMITTDLFGLLLPSINDLTFNEKSALMISIRPQKAPYIEIGPGNTDRNGEIIVGEALLNMKIEDLDLDFYAFINDRYTRIFTTTIDLNLGINLEVDGEGKILPVLGKIRFATDDTPGSISNLRVSNAEILREKESYIAELLPSIVEMAMGMIPLNFDPIALPSFMGFGMNIKDIIRIQEGNDEETKNFIGIFADILIGLPQTHNIRINSVTLEDRFVPRIKKLRKGKQPYFKFTINSDYGDLEYQYRINDGFWSPFIKGHTVKIDNPVLRLQGKYRIDIRARRIGKPETLSRIITKTVIVDSIAPKISLKPFKDKVVISAKDNISKNIKYFVSVDNSPYKEYNKAPIIKIPVDTKSVLIKVRAIDKQGNESFVSERFNMDNRIMANNLDNAENTASCSYGAKGDSSFVLMLFLALLFILRKNKKFIILFFSVLALFFASCSDVTENGNCKKDSDCEGGKVCVNNHCKERDIQCEENDTRYECSDCYIPGRCTEPDGNNPCHEGCECNTTFGQCFKIDGYCKTDDECEENFECKDNRCMPQRCQNDNDCAYMADSCTMDHSHPICTQSGACSCFIPCDGGCPTGKFCCLAQDNENFNQCLVNPVACEDKTCEPGYEVKVTQEGSIDDEVTCERVGVVCECVEKPHLKLGSIGVYSKSTVWDNNRIIVVGYSVLYGDLVLGLYDENVDTVDEEHIKWTFIDGILNDGETDAEVTNGPTGPRGGISQKGIDVGEYASVAVDSQNKIHIAYRDKEHKSLRYITVVKHQPSNENDKKLWDISEPEIVDRGGDERDTGYYTGIALDNSGNPSITYMTKDYKENGKYKSSLNIAVKKPDNTWEIKVLDSQIKDIPCNNSCSENQRCLYDENAVLQCERDLIETTFASTYNGITIPDNNSEGITSVINVPSNTFIREFRISYRINHGAVGQLKVLLITPEGEEYALVNPVTENINSSTPDGITVVNKKIPQIKDIDGAGNWVLKVVDTYPNIQGSLSNWSIKIKTRRNNSPYCGATCQNVSDTCNPECSSMSGEICAGDGVCKKQAKEMRVKYYLKGVGLFNKTVKLGNNLAVLYYDSINDNLKYILYKPSTMHTIEMRVIDSKAGRNANMTFYDDMLHITYRDRAGNLRYLPYAVASNPGVSMIIDDGLRIDENGKYELHKVGSDALVVKTENNEYDIYYFDASSREILKKHYNKSTGEIDDIPQVFIEEKDDATYDGTFGFYLNHVKVNNQDVFTSFYYKTQVGSKVDADYSRMTKPDSIGRVRVIK